MNIDFLKILNEGITISSSGTSGAPKDYFQPPEKLKYANLAAIDAQKISSTSRIYTCCKTSHAGGLLAQTLPALSIGATVNIVPFNAYQFVKDISKYTHTHITPLHAKAIMMTKGFKTLDLSNIWVTCGADPVTWDIIRAFVERGATFMTNWGMSEVGPIAINSVFTSLESIDKKQKYAPLNATVLGDTSYCEYRIDNNELSVKGDICIFNNWYQTKDKVVLIDKTLYYLGRLNKEVNIWKPMKG